MDRELFCRTFPQLYHMAHRNALAGIRQHGLLSTTALVDLFEVPREQRARILTRVRPDSIVIEHPVHGLAVIRDQKPLVSERRLAQALQGTATTEEFLQLLNSRVFFWVNSDRLEGLRNAVAYRGEPQLVLTLDTRSLVGAYGDAINLCPMNSGACRPMPHPRSPDIFQSIQEYDFEFNRRRKGSREKAVVECTVHDRVEDIGRFLIAWELVG
jgi:hypothetical protein